MANSGEEHLAALRCLDDTTDGFDSIRLPGDYHLEALFTTPLPFAASKVFSIAELLDPVLVYASSNETISPSCLQPEFPLPACSLFMLQRVNKMFKAAIARNNTIQQRMFLTRALKGSSLANPLSRIEWFGKMIRKFPSDAIFNHTDPNIKFITLGNSFFKCLYDLAPDSNASWKDMKLHVEEDAEPLRVLLNPASRVEWTFTYEGGMTMGKLYGGLLKLAPLQLEWRRVVGAHGTGWFSRAALYVLEKECTRADLWD